MMKKLFIGLVSGIVVISLFTTSLLGYEAVKIEGAIIEGVVIGEECAGIVFISEAGDTNFAGTLQGTADKKKD
ncbi:MAG: hypothetical protein ACTSR2_06250 [Candidatus Hodarchaeales archaeon]